MGGKKSKHEITCGKNVLIQKKEKKRKLSSKIKPQAHEARLENRCKHAKLTSIKSNGIIQSINLTINLRYLMVCRFEGQLKGESKNINYLIKKNIC